MAVELTEPVENRPWRSEDGPRPTVWSWPARDRPALYVWGILSLLEQARVAALSLAAAA